MQSNLDPNLPFVVDEDQPDLGGNLRHGDLGGFTPKAWTWIVQRFAIRSMLDVGCGEGHSVDYFRRLKVISHGIDGLISNVESAVTPVALHDLKTSPYIMPVDLVLCIEVVEHLEECFLDNLLMTFRNGRILVMTHAVPGQGGYHHVNCQPQHYWVDRLNSIDFTLLHAETSCVRKIASSEGWWNHMERTGLVFGRR